VAGAFNWWSGDITGGGRLETGGVVTVSGAGTRRLVGRTWYNRGTVNWVGADMELTDSLSGFVNEAGGTVNIFGPGALGGVGSFTNAAGAALNKQSPVDTELRVPVTGAGYLNANAGTLRFTHPEGYHQSAGYTNLNGGRLEITAGAYVLDGGTLAGTGDIIGSVVNEGGRILAGLSPGWIAISGDLALGPASILVAEVGGDHPGINHDLIAVTGHASLGGVLEVQTWGGYRPAAGDGFAILTYGTAAGDFAAIMSPPGYLFGGARHAVFYGVDTLGAPTPYPGGRLESAAMLYNPIPEIVVLEDLGGYSMRPPRLLLRGEGEGDDEEEGLRRWAYGGDGGKGAPGQREPIPACR